MILFFGPPGSGKSIQGQMLAARHGWRWISAGQLVRDTRDSAILNIVNRGDMLDSHKVNEIVSKALEKSIDIEHLILDGYPRQLDQAEWLVENLPEHETTIALVIVLEVPKEETIKRLKIRGRADDNEDVIEKRLKLYEQEISPVLGFLAQKNIPVRRIDGTGFVGQIHDRIEAALKAYLGEEI